MRKNSGFTLIELMVSIVIVGILSTTALPSYKKYIVKSKMAEAYTMLDVAAKNQITYYNENTDFYYIDSIDPTITQPPMLMETNARWAALGYPAPVGAKVTFAYNSHAGKINSAGTEITAPGSSSSGNGFANRGNALLSTAIQGAASVQCNVGLASNAALGAPSAANSDWALVSAIGDLDSDYTTECTVVTMLIESTTANGRRPSIPSGFLITRYGK